MGKYNDIRFINHLKALSKFESRKHCVFFSYFSTSQLQETPSRFADKDTYTRDLFYISFTLLGSPWWAHIPMPLKSVGPIDTQRQTLTLSLYNLYTHVHKYVVNLLFSVFFFLLLFPHDIHQWCMSMREKHRETKGEKLTHPLLIRELYNQITKRLTSPGWAMEQPPG